MLMKSGVKKQVRIEDQSVMCRNELAVDTEKRCIRVYYNLNFDVDYYFGADYKNDPDVFVSFYTEWFPEQEELRAFLVESNSFVPYAKSWALDSEEKEFFRQKMEAYCRETEGKSLAELWAEVSNRRVDITEKDIRCVDELLIEDGCIEATYELWFDVDQYFGTDTNDDEDTWINFYTEWIPETGQVRAVVTVDSPMGTESTRFPLSCKEQEFFYRMMNAYCKKTSHGLCLRDLWHLTREYSEIEMAFYCDPKDAIPVTDELADKIALYHMDKHNANYWNGKGEKPFFFDDEQCDYPVHGGYDLTDDLYIRISYRELLNEITGEKAWFHVVQIVDKELGTVYVTHADSRIDSVEALKSTILAAAEEWDMLERVKYFASGEEAQAFADKHHIGVLVPVRLASEKRWFLAFPIKAKGDR